MTRRKGETTARQINRDWPHQVEVKIPPGGLGTRLNAMHDFARGRVGLDYRTRSLRGTSGEEAMRWCFRGNRACDGVSVRVGRLTVALSSRRPAGWRRETVRTAVLVLALAAAAGIGAALIVLLR